MIDWVKKALTRKLRNRGRPALVIEPDEKLVLLVKFTIVMTLSLAGLEVACLLVLHAWNYEVFAAISGLVGTVTGVLIGRHA
jgi:hypothetical protein